MEILKSENRNPKKSEHLGKVYDLEERTFLFTKAVIRYCRELPKDFVHYEIRKQLIRSAGSVGVNYIEANENLGEKDFRMRIRISRKEAKESRYWLSLTEPFPAKVDECLRLIQESTELMNIFGSIARRLKWTFSIFEFFYSNVSLDIICDLDAGIWNLFDTFRRYRVLTFG